jgi:hypothetical protein
MAHMAGPGERPTVVSISIWCPKWWAAENERAGAVIATIHLLDTHH